MIFPRNRSLSVQVGLILGFKLNVGNSFAIFHDGTENMKKYEHVSKYLCRPTCNYLLYNVQTSSCNPESLQLFDDCKVLKVQLCVVLCRLWPQTAQLERKAKEITR